MHVILAILLFVFGVGDNGANNSHYTASYVSSINSDTCSFNVDDVVVPWDCATINKIAIGRSVQLERNNARSKWHFGGFYHQDQVFPWP